MDAETRAVSERLRDGLTERGLLDDARTVGLRWWHTGGEGGGTSVVRRDGCVWIAWDDGDESRTDAVDALPDLSAPATWGVLLGMLAEADPLAVIDATESVVADLWHGHRGDWGLALARALLAAWGQG